MGVTIVGVSFGTPSKHQEWAEAEGFQFELWTDDDRTLSVTYNAAEDVDAWVPDRVTVVLNEAGDLILMYPEVNTGTHPGQVLDDLTLLLSE